MRLAVISPVLLAVLLGLPLPGPAEPPTPSPTEFRSFRRARAVEVDDARSTNTVVVPTPTPVPQARVTTRTLPIAVVDRPEAPELTRAPIQRPAELTAEQLARLNPLQRWAAGTDVAFASSFPDGLADFDSEEFDAHWRLRFIERAPNEEDLLIVVDALEAIALRRIGSQPKDGENELAAAIEEDETAPAVLLSVLALDAPATDAAWRDFLSRLDRIVTDRTPAAAYRQLLGVYPAEAATPLAFALADWQRVLSGLEADLRRHATELDKRRPREVARIDFSRTPNIGSTGLRPARKRPFEAHKRMSSAERAEDYARRFSAAYEPGMMEPALQTVALRGLLFRRSVARLRPLDGLEVSPVAGLVPPDSPGIWCWPAAPVEGQTSTGVATAFEFAPVDDAEIERLYPDGRSWAIWFRMPGVGPRVLRGVPTRTKDATRLALIALDRAGDPDGNTFWAAGNACAHLPFRGMPVGIAYPQQPDR